MEVNLDRRAVKLIRVSAQDAIEEGDTEALREDILEAFSEEQVEEIERRIDNGDFFEFLTELLDEWSVDDVEELFELLETSLSENAIDLKYESLVEQVYESSDDEFDDDDDLLLGRCLAPRPMTPSCHGTYSEKPLRWHMFGPFRPRGVQLKRGHPGRPRPSGGFRGQRWSKWFGGWGCNRWERWERW